MKIDWLFWIELAMLVLAGLLVTQNVVFALVIGAAAIVLDVVRRVLGIRDDVRTVRAPKAQDSGNISG
jgi:hypothetical protein